MFETDPLNQGLVTNPHSMWKLCRADKFLGLDTNQQVTVLEILIKTLSKCANNCHILCDTSGVNSTALRLNQSVISILQQDSLPDLTQLQGCPQDILFQLLLIGLNCDHPQVYEAIRLLGYDSPQFERSHIELVYQYVRVAPDQTLQRALSLLTALLSHNTIQSQSYFFFNGFLSGILLNQKVVQAWPFNKGFSACMWFNISSFMAEGKMQDPTNLPVLFNCYSANYGGFECYFNQSKLFYRILPPSAYQPPTIDSNGIPIGDFQPNRWNFLAIEHDKPFLARAQLIAIVNDKQVVNFSMDYPKFDKASKLSQVCMCNNFIGQMANFVLFKEQINNPQKFVQIFKTHQSDFKQFDLNVFEQRLQEKLFLMFSPTRTNGKVVYDCIDMNDGELLINCGVWGYSQSQRRPLLQEQGGLQSLLGLLVKCKTADQVNQFLKILLAVISSEQGITSITGSNIFSLLFTLIQNLPYAAVNRQTVQLLHELRFTIQDRKQSEIFFKNLLMSADFWISTENIEVVQEFWSFVKAIYSQNPVQHNSIFPIHNLISLMVKISDTKQQDCCTYHKRTQEIFYGPQNIENSASGEIYKQLEPIAGVLECVLTSGGDEIMAQIEHITRSLTLKSCPCFHIQMLKLLKVLLLDSKSHNECASPLEFAQKFLNAHGLQILLYLCANNAALDVKSMCIKLIDVLSSHSSLIQMRIDTDLITYLSHVILPVSLAQKQLLQNNSNSIIAQGIQTENVEKPKYYLMGSDELSSPQKVHGLKFFSYQEAVVEDTDQKENFSEQEVMDEDSSFEIIANKQVFSKTLNNIKTKNIAEFEDNNTKGADEDFFNDESGSPNFIPQPAPKTTKFAANKGFGFGGLALEGSSDPPNSNSLNKNDDECHEEIESEKQADDFKPHVSAQTSIQKPRGLASLLLQDDDADSNDGHDFKAPPSRADHQKRFGDKILGDYNSDEDNSNKRKDAEVPKPTVDVLMSRNLRSGAGKGFNFGALSGSSDSESQSDADKEKSEHNQEQEEVKEQVLKPPPIQKGKFGSAGLKIQLTGDDSPKFNADARTFKTTPSKKQFQPPRGLQLSLGDSNVKDNRLVGTTGATNDVDFDEQQVMQQTRKPAFKPTLGLKLDTDKINDLFTFGGEKGEMKDEQAFEKLEDDIKELALLCVTAMRKKKSQQANDFQLLLQRPERQFANSSEHHLLNKHQAVKGIKNIELEQRLQRPLSLPDVLEESENLNLPSLYTPTTTGLNGTGGNLSIPFHQYPAMSETQKSQSDDYTGELENLYTSCLEWILNRAPSGLFKTMMIDDYDKITFLPAMQVLMILVSHSNNLVRQRALQDMFMLAQWDSQNGQLLLQHKSFHSWLLELLTPYQQERQSESAKAVYDMGTKLHTLLLKNSCTSLEEDEGFKKVNLLARWPTVVAEKGFDANSAHDLARSLIISLSNNLGQQQPHYSISAMKNLTHLTLQVHEFILCSSESKLQKGVEQKHGHNEPLFQWVLKSYLRYNYCQSEDAYLWTDWQLSSAIIQSWDNFFIGHKMKQEDNDSIYLEKTVRSLLFSKSQEDLQQIVELLMQVDQNASSPHLDQQIQSTKTYQSRLMILGGFGKTPAAQKGQSQPVKVSVFTLQALVNIICVSLTQANAQGDKVLLKQWLTRLELYFKYTIIVSELWRSKSSHEDPLFGKGQRKMAEICSFMLAFLFQEIHSNQTPKSQHSGNNQVSEKTRSDNSPSPQNETLHKSKIFQSCLKSCLIFMINMAGMQQDQVGHKERAIQIILQQILVKQYSNSSKPLISNSDISRLIESNFEEFPECFQQNDWKLAFFHNSLINQSITYQLNSEMIDGFRQKRVLYAIRLKEAEASTTQANEEILKKIQADTLQAISEVSHLEHDSKNESILLLDFYTRASQAELNQWVKLLTGSRGIWYTKPKVKFQKLQSQLLGEGQRCLLKDVHSNEFSMIPDHSFEQKIFLNVHRETQFLSLPQSDRFKFFTRKLTKVQHDELKFTSKQLLIDHLIGSLKQIVIECEGVSILRALEKRTGTLLMTNQDLIFVYEITTDESNTTIFFFQWQPTTKLTKQIKLSDVKEIQKRRFLGQNKALELFLMNNKTLLIDFKDVEQRDQFAKKLLRQRQNKCKNLIYHKSLDHKLVLKKSNLTEDWVNNKISNFKYLMALNQLAGRSYHDLSQYPVFPWILTFAKNNQMPDLSATTMRGGAPPSHFRDLTKNMQLLGSAERQAEFKRKYEDLEGFEGMNDRFHCGSHYSNPGIVLHYMARVQPILEANIVLQGNSMDDPNRIFQSIAHSYQHSLNDFSDVRELIPEFYCLPEMFVNSNFCNFGFKEDGTRVDDVNLPEWAQKNSQKFVQCMREAIESPYVSQNLNSWIDFIFGYKQRDTDAINCLNTFSKITYQVDQPNDFDITTVQDKTMRAALENQGYNFGQTPMQLFKEKHPVKLSQLQALKSNLVVDEVSKLKIFKPVPVSQVGPKSQTAQSLISPEAIMHAKFIDNLRIIGAKKEGYAQNFVWLPRAHDQNPQISFSLGSDKKQKFNGREQDKGMDQIDRSTKKFDYPMTISKDGNFIVKGGYWDGRVIFCPVEGCSVTQFELTDHKTTVTVLACDQNEQTFITGTKTGEVIVWRNANYDCTLQAPSQANPWVNIKQLNDHERQVTSIFINEEMCLFVTSSTDSYINMYNLWSAEIIRTFSHPAQLPVYSAVLAQSPIPLCAYYSRDDHMWYAYSLNGEQLIDPDQEKKVRQEESSHIVQPIVIKSSNLLDKLVYGTERGNICMRSLPSLERYRKLQVSKDFPVLTLLVSPDRRFLLTGCGDGGLIVITERGEQNQQTPQSSSSFTTVGYRSTRNSGQGSLNATMTNQSSILSSLSSLVGRSTTPGQHNQ